MDLTQIAIFVGAVVLFSLLPLGRLDAQQARA
jgi:hypothetical protein